jgi:hypothetical protein
MRPTSGRRFAARTHTSIFACAIFIAVGLALVPRSEAQAQHSAHQGHQMRNTSAKRSHAGHGASASDTPSTTEFKAAHSSMMQGMNVPYTGDPDVDFRIQMIPHHAGAIDMARVALRHAKDPWTRQLAESVIYEQQREIAEMQAWLTKHGVQAPASGQPRHVLRADSFRSVQPESGTRDELLGRSWAPGSGAPASR